MHKYYMPSVSIKQQRLMGMVKKCQESGECPSEKVKSMADSMKPADVKAFASTKHDNLPLRASSKKKKHKKNKKHHKKNESFMSFEEYVLLREGKEKCSCPCDGCKKDCKLCNCKNCKCAGCKCNLEL